MKNATAFAILIALANCCFAADTGGKAVTFSRDVAPILREKCEECHRKGTAAPMSLATYEEARPWAKSIRQRVMTRNMPPWHIDKTLGIQRFDNDRSLTEEQISTIVQWVDAGSPLGDPKDTPSAKPWPDDQGWQLTRSYGQPDLVLKSEPYSMPPSGQDVWFKPVTDVPLTEARWVRAVEIRPGSTAGRKMMHHVLARLLQDESALPANPNAPVGTAPGMLMEWAIGKSFDIYRPNSGKLILPGAKIWWEMHLHAVGEAIRDHAELALYLYPKGETPQYRTYLTMFPATPRFGSGIDIPPNTISQTQAFHVLKQPARLDNFQPHMHLRGKAMSIEAILPDGSIQVISHVNNFKFNWMNNYIYADDAAPVLPKGTMIHVTAWHDNTRANPNNPDPDQWVGFGDRTVDEMAHAWVNVTYISEADYSQWAARQKPGTPRH
jgi:hypothetical protein